MTFVDTSIWAAAYVSSDPRHRESLALLVRADELVTTDLVVVETLTLLRRRGHNDRAIEVGTLFFDQRPQVVRTTGRDHQFIRSLGIETALSLDHHFRQFGRVRVLPDAPP